MLVLVATVATSAFGQTPKREVVFTLNANEVIYENEYTLFQTLNQNRFACMTWNTITNEYTFVFNGEKIKIAPEDGNYYSYTWHLYYVNPDETKGYVFTYEENGEWYVNCRGVVDGGFDEIRCEHTYSYENDLCISEKDYDYLYKLADRWYASKNGKNKKINFIETIYKGGRRYISVNGSTVSGPYEYGDIQGYALTESGKYAYFYGDHGRSYINVNGRTVDEPYHWWHSSRSNLTLTESGKYAYFYGDNGERYLNVNGSIVGGPYEYYIIIENLTLTESGKYAYSYEDNDKCYVNVNGTTIGGPYTYVSGIILAEDGKYSYRFYKDRKCYTNTNGVVTEERDNQFLSSQDYRDHALDLTTKDGEHSFYSSYEYEFVVIDGRPHGKSPAIEAWYDESKNAFIWNAVEGLELVVYEYTLK
jgi:hypothetical protein